MMLDLSALLITCLALVFAALWALGKFGKSGSEALGQASNDQPSPTTGAGCTDALGQGSQEEVDVVDPVGGRSLAQVDSINSTQHSDDTADTDVPGQCTQEEVNVVDPPGDRSLAQVTQEETDPVDPPVPTTPRRARQSSASLALIGTTEKVLDRDRARRQLTNDERQDIHDIFDECDNNHNGSMDKIEFYKFCNSLSSKVRWIAELLGVAKEENGSKKLAPTNPADLFTKIDHDADESISKDELVSFIAERVEGYRSRKSTQLSMNAVKTGETHDDIDSPSGLRRRASEIMQNDVQPVFEECDPNRNDLDLVEFTKFCRLLKENSENNQSDVARVIGIGKNYESLFKRIDDNNSGTISRDELRQYILKQLQDAQGKTQSTA